MAKTYDRSLEELLAGGIEDAGVVEGDDLDIFASEPSDYESVQEAQVQLTADMGTAESAFLYARISLEHSDALSSFSREGEGFEKVKAHLKNAAKAISEGFRKAWESIKAFFRKLWSFLTGKGWNDPKNPSIAKIVEELKGVNLNEKKEFYVAENGDIVVPNPEVSHEALDDKQKQMYSALEYLLKKNPKFHNLSVIEKNAEANKGMENLTELSEDLITDLRRADINLSNPENLKSAIEEMKEEFEGEEITSVKAFISAVHSLKKVPASEIGLSNLHEFVSELISMNASDIAKGQKMAASIERYGKELYTLSGKVQSTNQESAEISHLVSILRQGSAIVLQAFHAYTKMALAVSHDIKTLRKTLHPFLHAA